MNVESVISVIVPVYNASSTIGRCVDSILAQSFANIECILVDDGSSDESGRICDEYAKKDDIWGEPDKMDNFFKEDDDWIDDMY